MKKTLQINISGFSFTIEEDAYLKLNNYLDSLKRYFSTYESRDEILQDIEARIAEKFFDKHQNSGIIETLDVEKIITSMGSVSDFEAVQDPEDLHQESSQSKGENIPPPSNTGSKKLYRDGKRKALGGVLAGIAHKYEFDVVWARIAFLVFALGLIGEGVGPVLIALYVVGWIVLPIRFDLEENPSVRKFYRNPEDKVIGGVASGLASYLRMDVKIVRVIFVVSGFFLIGIIFYLLFWIVAPVANSVTQKLQLEGQAVTIENIEKSVKHKEYNPEAIRAESTLSKILLFPFRLIGIIFSFLGKLISPIGSVLRFLAGLFLACLGISLAFSALLGLGTFFGLASAQDWISSGNFELSFIMNEIPALAGVFAFFALFIPGLAFIMAGIILMTNKSLGSRDVWVTLLVLWLVGILGTSTFVAKYATNFSKREVIEQTSNYTIDKNTVLLLDIEGSSSYSQGFRPDFRVSGNTINDVIVIKEFTSNGPTSEKALENAKNIFYNVTQNGSSLIFDKNFIVKEGDSFRDQDVNINLEIPKGVKFRFSKKFLDVIGYPHHFDTDANVDHTGNNTFIFNEENKLRCLDCPESNPYDEVSDNFTFDSFSNNFRSWDPNAFSKSITLSSKDFETIKISQKFSVVLVKADTVGIYVGHETQLSDIKTKVTNQTLEIGYEDPFKEYHEPTYIFITTPKVSGVNIEKEALLKMYGFDNINELKLNVEDNSKAAIHLNANVLNLNISEESNVILQGEIKTLKATADDKSFLKAQKAKINAVTAKATTSSIMEFGKVSTKTYNAEKNSVIQDNQED